MTESYAVHRWRFPDWMPSPVKSIACNQITSFVAIGREDGDVEVTSYLVIVVKINFLLCTVHIRFSPQNENGMFWQEFTVNEILICGSWCGQKLQLKETGYLVFP